MSTDLGKRLARLEARQPSLIQVQDPRETIQAYLQPHQLKFLDDPSRFKTAVCGRQGGKSTVAGALLLHDALKSKCVCIYITKTLKEAKEKFWRPVLLDLNKKLLLGGEPNESECYLHMPNGSYIYLIGANDEIRVEGLRGHVLKTVVVDEAQNVMGRLPALIDEVIVPALWREQGTLVLLGTPSPVPQGYFHDQAHSPSWSHHHFTFRDNPYIPKTVLEDELKRRGVKADDPLIQREFDGKWVLDATALVFRFIPEVNCYVKPPVTKRAWHHAIGVDLGYDDADAIAVLGWSPDNNCVYLVEEIVTTKQTVSELGATLLALKAKYQPRDIVVDTGGLGRKIVEEINQRFKLNCEAAEKTQKLAHIELVNDALRTGKILVKADSRFASDCLLVEWDRTNPEKPEISDRFHSDICDALLYAFRACTHWLEFRVEVPMPLPGTPEWQTAEMARIKAALVKKAKDRDRPDPWADRGDDNGFGGGF
jgi:hypothetical protein